MLTKGGVLLLHADGTFGNGQWSPRLTVADVVEPRGQEVRCPLHGEIVLGWAAACECGWRGQVWHRVAEPEHEDRGRRLLFSEQPYLPESVETVLLEQEWRSHVEARWRHDEIVGLAAEQKQVAARLDDAVRDARAAGLSWADIGSALGISRQGAHRRWADLPGAVAGAVDAHQVRGATSPDPRSNRSDASSR